MIGLIEFANKTANMKYKNYQFTTQCKSDEVTHPKQHKSFFWDNVTERSNCIYNPLDVTPVIVSLHSMLVTLNYRCT